MKYRQDNDSMFLHAKINTVRKTMNDDAPNVFSNNGKLEWMLRCLLYATVDLGHKFKSKAKSFALIPRTCFDKLCASGTMKSNRQIHCLILARAAAFTSLHGIASSGFAR